MSLIAVKAKFISFSSASKVLRLLRPKVPIGVSQVCSDAKWHRYPPRLLLLAG